MIKGKPTKELNIKVIGVTRDEETEALRTKHAAAFMLKETFKGDQRDYAR